MIRKASRNNRRGAGRESEGVWSAGVTRHESPCIYAYQYRAAIGARVRDPTASEVAMSPSPACRHTHTHISYFPFLFIRIAVGRGATLRIPRGTVAIIGEHGGPPPALPSRSRATILHLRTRRLSLIYLALLFPIPGILESVLPRSFTRPYFLTNRETRQPRDARVERFVRRTVSKLHCRGGRGFICPLTSDFVETLTSNSRLRYLILKTVSPLEIPIYS